MIYEVFDKTETKGTALGIADLTILGGFLVPSRVTEAEAFANAMLIDVFQGYPYGTPSIVLEKQKSYSQRWGSGRQRSKVALEAKNKAAIELVKQAEEMIRDLRLRLAEQQGKSQG